MTISRIDSQAAAEAAVTWLNRKVLTAARGDEQLSSTINPRDRYWLGLLYTLESVIDASMAVGDRADRIAPCAMGITARPLSEAGPWTINVEISWTAWKVDGTGLTKIWRKTPVMRAAVSGVLSKPGETLTLADDPIQAEMARNGLDLSLKVTASADITPQGIVIRTEVINDSVEAGDQCVSREIFEVVLEVHGFTRKPFVLEGLPDSFRYDRTQVAYGINCGVEVTANDSLRSSDVYEVDRYRPAYWVIDAAAPDLSFRNLTANPLEAVSQLCNDFERWGSQTWDRKALEERARDQAWSVEMLQQAKLEAAAVFEEAERIRAGVKLLEENPLIERSFRLMNEAMLHAAVDAEGTLRYEAWRPFQMAFIISMLPTIVSSQPDDGHVDTVWFATGGGKTETYLGLLVTTALYERLTGRASGIMAWSRFPLRMLSLQQTQRFANALAGAELTRMRETLGGDPISLGFFVGAGGTPNRIPVEPNSEADFDVEDLEAPTQFQILLECPFCKHESIVMGFNRKLWKLEHRCARFNAGCPWPQEALPFFIVDDEIYRFLPTVVVGTLDKAANLGMQTGMLGFMGPPFGRCDRAGHGYTYAKRSTKPNGCLVPGCAGRTVSLSQDPNRYGLTFRLQDELHLLRDSLGAVDAHYESLMDSLQVGLTGRTPKIIASSATLSGHERQTDVLFQRASRVFPQPGISAAESFWSFEPSHSNPNRELMRRFVALAARGSTLEFVNDRVTESIQQAIRQLVDDPRGAATEIGVDEKWVALLASLYGTTVVYGTTMRDVEAAHRSAETEIQVDGPLNIQQLTGGTPLDDVRRTLHRLDEPEEDFSERIHMIAASSMMSHGVDIDRLNIMILLGLPLTTAEFIQTSARVGRRWPGLVYVIHRPARERDAATFKDFAAFVRQGDRFVEPIAVTRASRRVADLTLPGVVEARRLLIHERNATDALSTSRRFVSFMKETPERVAAEQEAVEAAIADHPDPVFRQHVNDWLDKWAHGIEYPPPDARFPSDLLPGGTRPMRSLRDVEQQAPVREIDEERT